MHLTLCLLEKAHCSLKEFKSESDGLRLESGLQKLIVLLTWPVRFSLLVVTGNSHCLKSRWENQYVSNIGHMVVGI